MLLKRIVSVPEYDIYKQWYLPFLGKTAAIQLISEELYKSYSQDQQVEKFVFIIDGFDVGILFLFRDPSKTLFFDPTFFGSRIEKVDYYLPRGGFIISSQVLINDKLTLSFQKQIRELCGDVTVVIDSSGDFQIPCYDLFPSACLLDEMVGLAWQRDKCVLTTEPEKKYSTFGGNLTQQYLFESTRAVFLEGFKVSKSPCPHFDEDYYAELFHHRESLKSMLVFDGEIVGVVLAIPICLVPFLNESMIKTLLPGASDLVFVWEMVIQDTHRSIANFVRLGRDIISRLSEGSIAIMDYSVGANRAFPSGIRRALCLKQTDLVEIGRQKYELISF